jgi:hypothetical protein
MSSFVRGGPRARRLTTHDDARSRSLIGLAAFISFVLSVSLYFVGSEEQGIFVGLWVPSILALGAFLFPRQGR